MQARWSWQRGMMKDWNSVSALGIYLGIPDAGKITARAASYHGADRMLEAISGAASQFYRKLSKNTADDIMDSLAATDFARLSGREGDRCERLSEDLYRRLATSTQGESSLPQFAVFDRYFREYLRRFCASLRAVLYGMDIRKEIISLENPSVRESVEEVRQLPCRSCGAMASSDGRGHLPESLTRYVQSLLEPADLRIEPACRAKILEIMDHLAAYPGYYRQLDRESKAEAAQALVSAISSLRRGVNGDQDKADLLASLGILLFNVYPSPAIVKYLAVHQPGGRNRFLQYEYDAILALNYLRMGRRSTAAAYCGRAYQAAPDDDLKAYARMLEGCIALESRDYVKAAAALENALETADRRSLRSLTGFYLGIVRYEAGEIGRALNCFKDSRISAEGEADAMAACNNMGTCYMVMGDLGKALRSFEEAGSLGTYSGRASVKFNRTVAWGNSGIVYMSMREHGLAQGQFRKALKAARETGNARGVADQLMNIGLAQKAMGDYALACHHFVSGLNYAFTIDYIEGVLYAREQISQALALQGKHDEEEVIYKDIARRYPGIRKLLTRK